MQAHDTRRVVGYIRVSTGEQGRDGHGLDAQRAAIVSEAARRGWEVVEVVEEVASGAKLNRPGIAQVLELVEGGHVDALLVSKLDRLSRSVPQFSSMLERFIKAGWGLVIMDIGLDTTTIAGEAMAYVMATFANMERRRIGERTREGMAAAKAKGIRMGRRRELDENVRERILRMRAKGLTYRAIAKELAEEGAPTAHGGRWQAETIRSIVLAAK